MKIGVDYANTVAEEASPGLRLLLLNPTPSEDDEPRRRARALLAFNFSRPSTVDEIDERLGDPAQLCVALMHEANVVGALIGVIGDKRLEVHFFCSARQKFGYGGGLCQLMFLMAQKLHVKQLIAHSLASAADFWRRMGFQAVDGEVADEYIDTARMILSLSSVGTPSQPLKASSTRISHRMRQWEEEVDEQMNEFPRHSYRALQSELNTLSLRRKSALLSPVGVMVAKRISKSGGRGGRWQDGSIVDYWTDVGEYVIEWESRGSKRGVDIRERISDPRVLEVLVSSAITRREEQMY